ncbi:MAG: hypothetical protein R3A52_31635 [Polyangiales bacterium]
MLPDTNGFEVCQQLRRWSKTVPIVMLSARSRTRQDPRHRRRRHRH